MPFTHSDTLETPGIHLTITLVSIHAHTQAFSKTKMVPLKIQTFQKAIICPMPINREHTQNQTLFSLSLCPQG